MIFKMKNRNSFKRFFKKSPIIFNLSVGLIYIYIRLCIATMKWEINLPDGQDEKVYKKYRGALFAVWHNRLIYGIKLLSLYPPVKVLASPHSDGKIISKVVNLHGFEVVQGSTYRGATGALRAILHELKSGCNIVITPDGPRGPVGEINSAMVRIANKYDRPLIAISIEIDKCFRLNSWDRMMVPKLFSKAAINFSPPLELTGDEEIDKVTLKKALGSYE